MDILTSFLAKMGHFGHDGQGSGHVTLKKWNQHTKKAPDAKFQRFLGDEWWTLLDPVLVLRLDIYEIDVFNLKRGMSKKWGLQGSENLSPMIFEKYTLKLTRITNKINLDTKIERELKTLHLQPDYWFLRKNIKIWAENNKIRQKMLKYRLKIRKFRWYRENKYREIKSPRNNCTAKINTLKVYELSLYAI